MKFEWTAIQNIEAHVAGTAAVVTMAAESKNT
jgi:hypothetical protein